MHNAEKLKVQTTAVRIQQPGSLESDEDVLEIQSDSESMDLIIIEESDSSSLSSSSISSCGEDVEEFVVDLSQEEEPCRSERKPVHDLSVISSKYNSSTHDCSTFMKQKSIRTLVLDLDETLIHSLLNERALRSKNMGIVNLTECGEAFIKRPYLNSFIQSISQIYEIIIYTASTKEYALDIMRAIDPNNLYLRYLLSRRHCYFKSPPVKRLEILDRDPRQIIIVDDTLLNWTNDIDNLVPITPFYGDKDDDELLKLHQYLYDVRNYSDYREVNRAFFKLGLFIQREGGIVNQSQIISI